MTTNETNPVRKDQEPMAGAKAESTATLTAAIRAVEATSTTMLASLEATRVTLSEHLTEIKERLNHIYGNVRGHDNWIAARQPVCEQSLENLHSLSKAVSALTAYVDREEGERRATRRYSLLLQALLSLLIGAGATWAAIKVALH